MIINFYLPFYLVILLFINIVNGTLPNNFEKFIEILFETQECEDFLAGGELLGVETSECKPFTCDFPRQMCMRESSKYQDPSANQCVTIPAKCITAANGGVPIAGGNPGVKKLKPPPPPPPERFGGPSGINGNKPPPIKLVTAGPDLVITTVKSKSNQHKFGDICDQTVPDGRFCGFALKFTYNKETGNCEQFWFPGCRTESTNDNLFDNENQCRQVTKHCSEGPITTTQKPMRIRIPTPKHTTTPKPKPKRQPKPKPKPTTPEPEYPEPEIGLPPRPKGANIGGVDFGSLAKTFMGGGSSGGLVGQFLGSGLGGGSNGPPPSSRVPNGYGGAQLGGAGAGTQIGQNGNGAGGGNFISLIANTVKELGNQKNGNGKGGGVNAAKVAQQWLNPNQFGSLFSSFGK